MKLAIEHRWECTGPDLIEFDGRQGDRVEQCRTCGRLRALPGPGAVAVALPEVAAAPSYSRYAPVPEPIAAPVLSGYVCRDHLEPTNWRGKGCARCDAEMAKRGNARRGGDRDE